MNSEKSFSKNMEDSNPARKEIKLSLDGLRQGALSVWAGGETYLLQNATQIPVVHNVSIGYKDLDECLKAAHGQKPGRIRFFFRHV